MVVAAIPSVISDGHAVAPFVISIILLAFGESLRAHIVPVGLIHNRYWLDQAIDRTNTS
jgi:hypothetical protein